MTAYDEKEATIWDIGTGQKSVVKQEGGVPFLGVQPRGRSIRRSWLGASGHGVGDKVGSARSRSSGTLNFREAHRPSALMGSGLSLPAMTIVPEFGMQRPVRR